MRSARTEENGRGEVYTVRVLAPYDFPTENLRRALILLLGCHVVGRERKLGKAVCAALEVCKESLVIRLYK